MYALWMENGSHREADRLCFECLMPSWAVLLGAGHRNLRSQASLKAALHLLLLSISCQNEVKDLLKYTLLQP